MLYGRRLEDALDQVGESRYALVHALARRSRQITRHLAQEHIDLDTPAESAPTIAGTEGDPLKIAEEEIIEGLVIVGEPIDEVIQVSIGGDIDPLLAAESAEDVADADEVEASDPIAQNDDEVEDDAVDTAPIVTAEERDDADLGSIVAAAKEGAHEDE